MKGQEVGPGLGMIYITFFILLIGVGGYWILHSSTWIDYNLLYGPSKTFNGKVVRIESYCDDPKKTIFMLDTSTSSQAYIYMASRLDIMVGDSVTVTAYNVTGKGLIFDLMRSKCEPSGAHYYATKVYSSRTAIALEGKPWQK